MKKIIAIHMSAFLLAMMPLKAKAFIEDYEVDWPSSQNGIHVLRISINGCETLFKVKDKDFYDFAANKEAVKDALNKAIARAKAGCH